MICTINIQSAYVIWDELIKKVGDHEQKKSKILPTYLLKPLTYTHLLLLSLLTYLAYTRLFILTKLNLK